MYPIGWRFPLRLWSLCHKVTRTGQGRPVPAVWFIRAQGAALLRDQAKPFLTHPISGPEARATVLCGPFWSHGMCMSVFADGSHLWRKPAAAATAMSQKGGDAYFARPTERRLWHALWSFPTDSCRRALRPIEASKAAIRNGCFTSTPAVGVVSFLCRNPRHHRPRRFPTESANAVAANDEGGPGFRSEAQRA